MLRRNCSAMEIKKREVLCSVILVCIMLILGVVLGNSISQSATRTAERYATATVIKDTKQFRYGMDTDFGNALVYGEVSSDESVTFDEIGNGYLYIEKVREVYTRHTRTVTRTDSNGKTYTTTEVYYSWDYAGSEEKQVETILFLGESFPYGTIGLSAGRLDLEAAGVKAAKWNYIYTRSDIRYYYAAIPLSVTGTVFADLRNGTMSNVSSLYVDEEPEQVIAEKQNAETVYLIVFWFLWVGLTVAAVFGFLYLDNRWLD